MPQIRQGALDAAIAPGGILFGHADDQLFDLLCHTGSTKVATVVASVELLRDQAVVPAQEGLRGGNRGHLLQACAAERVGHCREAAAFGVGQMQPATAEMGFEDAVFCLQVGDDLLLITVDPASEHGE